MLQTLVDAGLFAEPEPTPGLLLTLAGQVPLADLLYSSAVGGVVAAGASTVAAFPSQAALLVGAAAGVAVWSLARLRRWSVVVIDHLAGHAYHARKLAAIAAIESARTEAKKYDTLLRLRRLNLQQDERADEAIRQGRRDEEEQKRRERNRADLWRLVHAVYDGGAGRSFTAARPFSKGRMRTTAGGDARADALAKAGIITGSVNSPQWDWVLTGETSEEAFDRVIERVKTVTGLDYLALD